jgi:F-type H+-transporting ATPase subunit b
MFLKIEIEFLIYLYHNHMDIVQPAVGLIFWTLISFLILLVILRAFAWKPILSAVTERERSIEEALSKAEAAKEEMSRLTNENEALLKQARAERDVILAEAKPTERPDCRRS